MRGNVVREKKLEREMEEGGNGTPDGSKTQFQMPTVGVKIKNIKYDIILFCWAALIHNICICYYYAIVVHMYMYYTKIPVRTT